MKQQATSVWDRLGLVGVLSIVLVLVGCELPPPEQRPGDAYEGSLYWAIEVATPTLQEVAADMQIHEVNGLYIYQDGRLPANIGSWTLQAWSASLNEGVQVAVNYNGDQTTTMLSAVPGHEGLPLPVDFLNSTDVFSLIPDATPSTVVVLNQMGTMEPGFWVISQDNVTSGLVAVSHEGVYIGEIGEIF